jgi:hypothetical protein
MNNAKMLQFVFSTCALSAIALLPARAQPAPVAQTPAAPDYDSGVVAGAMSDSNFNTPTADGRPGVKFFDLAVKALRKGDFAHAVEMYKVAASWAYKPAEYNLAVMYYKGQGIPVDRALGAAWIVLAAERKDPYYLKVQNLMVSPLTDAQFAKTNEHWRELKKTYGDEVALPRAKAQWAWVRTHQTGTRTGGFSGPVQVGVLDGGHTPSPKDPFSGQPLRSDTNAASLFHGGSVDSSIAYAQYRQSDNPYDPVFRKDFDGTVVVGPIAPASNKDKSKASADHPAGNRQQQPLH